MTIQNGALKVALGKGSAAGSILALANPAGAALIVTRVVLDITTGAGGAFTADAGIAANGTTSADNLLDGASIVAAGVLDNIENQGTNGVSAKRWEATEYLTISPSADIGATGFVGNAYIEYIYV